MENSNTKKEATTQKKQENTLLTNLKEDSHINIILPLTTKITGSNRKQQSLFLKISKYQWTQFLNKKT